MSDLFTALASAGQRLAKSVREKNDQLGCAYPDCTNHKKGVTRYCCNGCRWDHEESHSSKPVPKATKVPIGAHALITFGSPNIVITKDYIDESEKWFKRFLDDGWEPEYCEAQSWMVLLNGAYQSTDYDPTKRYDIEKGKYDGIFHVVDTTRMSPFVNETKYLSLARCYKYREAQQVMRAMNAYNNLKTARRKNG